MTKKNMKPKLYQSLIIIKILMEHIHCQLKKAMAKVGKYCVQDSVLVADIFEHLQIWLSFSEMSRTCTTPIMTIHVHGQQVKFFNQVYKYCYDHKR